MKYTLEQRLDIGRRIYEGELTRFQAAEEYGINDNTARNYMWLYRDTNHLPPKNAGRKRKTDASKTPQPIEAKQPDFESYEAMTKEELIQALIQARITEARLKKGYEVKGDGSVIHQESFRSIFFVMLWASIEAASIIGRRCSAIQLQEQGH